MTNSQPPRLALALVHRAVGDDDPLIGDLLEEFGARQSRLWFWRQALFVVAIVVLRGGDTRVRDPRPLRLLAEDVTFDVSRMPAGRLVETRPINLGATPVHGVGGLGVMSLVVLVAIVNPQALWFVSYGIATGVFFGIGLVLIRRQKYRKATHERGAILIERS